MTTRRRFLKTLGLGLVAGASGLPSTSLAAPPLPAPHPAAPLIRVALLADAHLPDADEKTGPARRLLAAVEAINTQEPPLELAFYLGDLSDQGASGALALGKAILDSLRPPCWLLPGEGEVTAAAPWTALFGPGRFSFAHQGWHFLGLDTTVLHPVSRQYAFQVGFEHQAWLAGELARLEPTTPLVIFSHGPLYRLFQPWHWWTREAEVLHDLLAGRERVFLFNGHVHQNIALQQHNLVFQGVRATAWPSPDVRLGHQGEPPGPPANPGREGCGWMLLTCQSGGELTVEDKVWGA